MIDRDALLGIVRRTPEPVAEPDPAEDIRTTIASRPTADVRSIRADLAAWRAQGQALHATLLAGIAQAVEKAKAKR